MEYYVSNEKREQLRTAFHKVAMAKSPSLESKVLETTTKLAFVRELAEIDPGLDFEKTAGFWDFVKKWGPDIALTALMFVPGINVGAGAMLAARGALAVGRAGLAARKVYQAGRAVKGLRSLKTMGSALRGPKAVASSFRKAQGLKPGTFLRGANNTQRAAWKSQAQGGRGMLSKAWHGTGKGSWRGGGGLKSVVGNTDKATGAWKFSPLKTGFNALALAEGVPAASRMVRGKPKTWGDHMGGGGAGQSHYQGGGFKKMQALSSGAANA